MNENNDIVDESFLGPSLQSGTKHGLFSYLFDRSVGKFRKPSAIFGKCSNVNIRKKFERSFAFFTNPIIHFFLFFFFGGGGGIVCALKQ